MAMLMHSCSKELVVKFSKPKISSRPTARFSPLFGWVGLGVGWMDRGEEEREGGKECEVVVNSDH